MVTSGRIWSLQVEFGYFRYSLVTLGTIWLYQVWEGAGRGRGARRGGGRQEAHPGDEDDGEASVHQLRHLGQRQGQSYTGSFFFF